MLLVAEVASAQESLNVWLGFTRAARVLSNRALKPTGPSLENVASLKRACDISLGLLGYILLTVGFQHISFFANS